MRRNICAAYARRQIRQCLLAGFVSLALGIYCSVWIFSGGPLAVLYNLGKNFVHIAVILFLVLGGGYLLFSGARGLIWTEATDLCRYIRFELSPEAKSPGGKELFTLVDRDLASALEFSNGNILIGQEWLFVQNAWGKPIIRLEHIQQVWHSQTKRGDVMLKFADSRGVGPVTRELTASEAGLIQTRLQRRVVYRQDFSV